MINEVLSYKLYYLNKSKEKHASLNNTRTKTTTATTKTNKNKNNNSNKSNNNSKKDKQYLRRLIVTEHQHTLLRRSSEIQKCTKR